MLRVALLLCTFFASSTSEAPCTNKFCVRERSREILTEEASLSFGGVELSRKERLLQSMILGPMKAVELLHYNGVSNSNSDLYHFIRKMPKGGDLHIHDISMVNIDWVISEMTYLPNLYYCDTQGGQFLRFRYSDMVPEREDFCDESWISVKERREEIGPEDFDKTLYDKMTMDNKYEGMSSAWNKFSGSIRCVTDLLYSDSGFNLYFKEALTELYEDNVLYVEVRTLMTPILSNSGERFSREETLQRFINITEDFKKENPGFIGAKFIFVSVRSMPKDSIETDIKTAMELHQKYPYHLIGYDLAGYEDDGQPISELLDILFIPAENGIKLPFFLHAGETKRFGRSTDENILSAILLNTTRIGHAFALPKHPLLMETVKKRDIAIEVSPTSNQVLNLVADMRNHPGAVLFANGVPVVICSDDPAPWKTSGLSYDYHAAFMAFTKAEEGLEVFKKMSRNGIKYSAMTENEKSHAFKIWRKRWKEFVSSFSLSFEVNPLPPDAEDEPTDLTSNPKTLS